MKLVIFLSLFLLLSCNKESSPEGRMQIKYDALELKIDSLSHQHKVLMDRFAAIREDLAEIKRK